nr:hypothetical protein [uncultured Cohaesibacter sp.]
MTAIVNPDGSQRLIALEDLQDISLMTARFMKTLRHGSHRGRVALEKVTRVSNMQLRRYEDATDSAIMPLDIVMEMEVILGFPHFAAWLADIHGYDLVKRNAGLGESMLAMCAKSIKEAAEAHETILEAEEDGVESLEELRAIKKESSEAKDIFAEIEAKASRNIKRMLEAN